LLFGSFTRNERLGLLRVARPLVVYVALDYDMFGALGIRRDEISPNPRGNSMDLIFGIKLLRFCPG